MLHTLQTFIGPALALAGLILAPVLARRIKTPSDLERANLIAMIAQDSARLVVALFPAAAWSALLEQTVAQMSKVTGLPTNNAAVIERAAASALTVLGKNPGTAR